MGVIQVHHGAGINRLRNLCLFLRLKAIMVPSTRMAERPMRAMTMFFFRCWKFHGLTTQWDVSVDDVVVRPLHTSFP